MVKNAKEQVIESTDAYGNSLASKMRYSYDATDPYAYASLEVETMD